MARKKIHPTTQRLMDEAMDLLRGGPASTSTLLAVLKPGEKVTSSLLVALRRLERQRKVIIGPKKRGGAIVTLRQHAEDQAAKVEPGPAPIPITKAFKAPPTPKTGTELAIEALFDLLDRDMAIKVLAQMVRK